MGSGQRPPNIGQKTPEYERRFVVLDIDPDTFTDYPKRYIEQAYMNAADHRHGFRTRILDGARQAILTMKEGHGAVRIEDNADCSVGVARFMMRATDEVIYKTRHYRDGWEVDLFEKELTGLVLAEKETATPYELTPLPSWIGQAVEVTEHLSNRDLARLAKFLRGGPPVANIAELVIGRVPRVVLTGGPGSGKSVMVEQFMGEFGQLMHRVPETATIIISTIGCRPPVGDPLAMGIFQEVVFRCQRGFEMAANIQAHRDGKKIVLLDRATGDNAAYLPNGWADLELYGKTTKAYEYRQYDLVICLEPPPRGVYERECRNNPARTETYEQAVERGLGVQKAWGDHPNFVYVPNSTDWETKVDRTRRAILDFMASHDQ